MQELAMRASRRLNDFSRLRIKSGRIHYFLYQQDGAKQPMSCRDTASNRLLVSWMQIHDSRLTGNEKRRSAGLL